jgi:hypothetical protein
MMPINNPMPIRNPIFSIMVFRLGSGGMGNRSLIQSMSNTATPPTAPAAESIRRETPYRSSSSTTRALVTRASVSDSSLP